MTKRPLDYFIFNLVCVHGVRVRKILNINRKSRFFSDITPTQKKATKSKTHPQTKKFSNIFRKTPLSLFMNISDVNFFF